MDFLIGGTAATCAGVFSNPFDVIKTRQQLQGELQQHIKSKKQPYANQWLAIRSIVRAEGITGLQKGNFLDSIESHSIQINQYSFNRSCTSVSFSICYEQHTVRLVRDSRSIELDTIQCRITTFDSAMRILGRCMRCSRIDDWMSSIYG